jgi:UDP-glucose 4-epimerase
MGEAILNQVSSASAANAVGAFNVASLRYFNGPPALADTSVANLVPMVFEEIRAGRPPFIFGDDYDIPDGTCLRDYVHVGDLAEAHLAALDFLATTTQTNSTFKFGSGRGYSIKKLWTSFALSSVLPPSPS